MRRTSRPRSNWPTGLGFERYYGFLGGETNEWYPDLVQDRQFVDQPYDPPRTYKEWLEGTGAYHLSKDLADRAISIVVDAKQVAPERTFFTYFCPGVNHGAGGPALSRRRSGDHPDRRMRCPLVENKYPRVLLETGCRDDHSEFGVGYTTALVSGMPGVLLADITTKVFTVDTGSFLAIVVTGAVAGSIAAVAGGRGLFLPVVVLELVLGVVIGPQGLGIARVNEFTQFFSDLGLGMLFFFAGYEIDIQRIRGRPLRLALLGWVISLAIAYGLGGVLAAVGVVVSLVYVGSALATTAIGTLLPVLSDTGELDTEFGTYLLAAGAVGEFGPVLLLTLVLSTQSPAHSAVILIAFIALAVLVALVAVRSSGHTLPVFERTIEKSSQLAVRWIVVLVFALGLLASNLGLDLLLGGFAAGMITRLVVRKHEVPGFDSKLNAVAFGVFIPFFFVVSGMRLDIDALFASPSGLGKLALFFVLFLVVRGTPALLLYRGVLPLREDRMALALFTATQLPLVVAITTLAVQEGHMLPSTAAALVGAGALSTLAGPLHGLHMRRVAALKRSPEERPEATGTGANEPGLA